MTEQPKCIKCGHAPFYLDLRHPMEIATVWPNNETIVLAQRIDCGYCGHQRVEKTYNLEEI